MYFSAIHHEKQIQNVPCKSFMLKHTQMERGVPSFSCKIMGRDPCNSLSIFFEATHHPEKITLSALNNTQKNTNSKG
jgi:hypothetical protein